MYAVSFTTERLPWCQVNDILLKDVNGNPYFDNWLDITRDKLDSVHSSKNTDHRVLFPCTHNDQIQYLLVIKLSATSRLRAHFDYRIITVMQLQTKSYRTGVKHSIHIDVVGPRK